MHSSHHRMHQAFLRGIESCNVLDESTFPLPNVQSYTGLDPKWSASPMFLICLLSLAPVSPLVSFWDPGTGTNQDSRNKQGQNETPQDNLGKAPR